MPSTHPTQHHFKGLQDWIEVFKAGDHVDSKGRAVSFTEADLDQMVANTATLGAAPLVLGHPKHDDPAYGWASEAKREGASLFIKASDVNPAFEAGVNSGAYRNRSVSIVKDKDHGWRLQHIGWLGAAPPAIAGLKPLEFSAADDALEFSASEDLDLAYVLSDIADLFRGLRESLIADKGIDAANAVLSDWRITSITSASERIRQAAMAEQEGGGPLFTQPTGNTMNFTQADLDRAAQEAAERARTEQQAQFSAQAAELARLQGERQAERISAQIAAWKAAGQLLPAEEAGLAEFMAALDSAAGGEFQFTAAPGGQPTKKTPSQFFAEFVASRGRLVKLGGNTGADSKNEGTALDTTNAAAIADAARQFQAAEASKGRTISIDQAVSYVTRQATSAA